MHQLSALTFNQLYHAAVVRCYTNGEAHKPRGHACLELRPAYLEVMTARHGLYTGRSRRLNYRFLAVETLGYLAGAGAGQEDAELLCQVNPNMSRFVNPATGLFDGAYGPRLIASLPAVEELLKRDPFSRQAVASIWSPGIPASSLDVPCTLSLHFWLTKAGHLDLQVLMRSNDLNWGTPYDVAAFCSIQCAMAMVLGVPPGTYHHVAGSLHLYEATPPTIVSYDDEKFMSVPLEIPYVPHTSASWLTLANEARTLLDEVAQQLTTKGALVTSCLIDGERSDYWGQWLRLLNFGWKSVL